MSIHASARQDKSVIVSSRKAFPVKSLQAILIISRSLVSDKIFCKAISLDLSEICEILFSSLSLYSFSLYFLSKSSERIRSMKISGDPDIPEAINSLKINALSKAVKNSFFPGISKPFDCKASMTIAFLFFRSFSNSCGKRFNSIH